MNGSYLTVAALLLSAGSMLADASDQLTSLCQDGAIELTTVPQLRSLAEKLKSQPEVGCDAKVKAAIVDALPVIEDEDACSKNKIDQISQYHANHLSKQSKIPKSLRQFMVAYGLKASSLCKSDLADSLSSIDTIDVEEFYRALQSINDIQTLFARLFGGGLDYNHSILANVIEVNIRLSRTKNNIHVASKYDKEITSLKNVCENKLESYYKQMIVPVVRLAGLGFDHRINDVFEQLSKERKSKLSEWYNIVFVCESLKPIKVVKSPNYLDDSAFVTILTGDELNGVEPLEGSSKDDTSTVVGYLKQRSSMIDSQVLYESDRKFRNEIENVNLDTTSELFTDIEHLLRSLDKYLNGDKTKYGANERARLSRNKRSIQPDGLFKRVQSFVVRTLATLREGTLRFLSLSFATTIQFATTARIVANAMIYATIAMLLLAQNLFEKTVLRSNNNKSRY